MRLKSTTRQTWDGWLHHCFLLSAKSVVDPFSSVEKSRRDVVGRFQFSGNRFRRVKEIEIWRVCKILKWKGKEFCPHKDIRDFLEKKADHAFQGEMAA